MESMATDENRFARPEVAHSYRTFEGTPEAKGALMAALAKARLEFGEVVRDRTGQYGKREFPYATLGALTEATAKPLAKHGVFVSTDFTTSPADPKKHRMTMEVMGHGAIRSVVLDFAVREIKSEGEGFGGEWIKEYGKMQTYLIRYAYRAFFVLDSEPDADEAGTEPERRQEPRREPPRAELRQEPKRAPAPRDPAPQAKSPAPAPVSQVAPVNNNSTGATVAPEPKIEREPDEPATDEVGEALKTLREKLGINRIAYSEMVLKLTGMPATELRQSLRACRQVMEHMQQLVLQQPAGAA
jgi:hypothetical protein